MKNGTYQAKKNITVFGFFSMADVSEGQMVTIKDGDHDHTAFVECGPLATVEVDRAEEIKHLELVE